MSLLSRRPWHPQRLLLTYFVAASVNLHGTRPWHHLKSHTSRQLYVGDIFKVSLRRETHEADCFVCDRCADSGARTARADVAGYGRTHSAPERVPCRGLAQ